MSTSKKHDDESIDIKKKQAKQHASEPQRSNFAEYLRGVKTEWTKVTWPTWPQIWGQTLVVLFMVTIVSLGILVIDQTINFVTNILVPHQ